MLNKNNRKATKEELMELCEAKGYDVKNAIYVDGALWKPYLNDELDNTYMISTDGRVYCLDTRHYYNPKPIVYTGNTCGRRALKFKLMDGTYKLFYIYRMVAETFIPNPQHLETVNHKDECSYHDDVFNLEWMSQADNVNYGTRNQRMVQTRKMHQVMSQAENEMSDLASKKQK